MSTPQKFFPNSLLIPPNNSEKHSNDLDKNEKERIDATSRPLIIEVQSRRFNNVQANEDSYIKPITKNIMQQKYNTNEKVYSNQKEDTTTKNSNKSSSLMNEDEINHPTNITPSLPSRISMIFITIKSVLNQRSNLKDFHSTTCTQHVSQFIETLQNERDFLFTWEIILNGIHAHLSTKTPHISKERTRKTSVLSSPFTPHFILGALMMEAYPSALIHLSTFLNISKNEFRIMDKAVINPTTTKSDEKSDSKILAMAAIYFLYYYILQRKSETQNNDKNSGTITKPSDEISKKQAHQILQSKSISMPLILSTCLPLLYYELIEPLGSKRTNLSVLAMDLAFFLIHETSLFILIRSERSQTKNNAIEVFWSNVPLISKIVVKKEMWMCQPKNVSSTSSTANTDDDESRKQCMLAVLKDWNSLFDDAVRKHRDYSFDLNHLQHDQKVSQPRLNAKQHNLGNRPIIEVIDNGSSNQKKELKRNTNSSSAFNHYLLSNKEIQNFIHHLCYHLAGVEIPYHTIGLSCSSYVRVGGILQCLGSSLNKHMKQMLSLFKLMNTENYFKTFHASTMTVYNSDIDIIEKALNHAVSLFQQESEVETEKIAIMETQRCIIRGLAGFLAAKRWQALSKLWKNKTNLNTNHDAVHITIWNKMIEICLNLLRSQSEHCCDLSLTCLYRLWSDSERLPPELISCGNDTNSNDNAKSDKKVSPLFEDFINSLQELCPSRLASTKSHSSLKKSYLYSETTAKSEKLDVSQRAICTLISRCIRSQPEILLPLFLQKMTLKSHLTIEVLAMLVSPSDHISSVNSNSKFLNHTIGALLLDNLDHKYFQKKCNSFTLFLSYDVKIIIPRLINELSSPKCTNTEQNTAMKTSSDIICHILLHTHQIEDIINIIVRDFCQMEDKKNKSEPDKQCLKFISQWRRELLCKGGDGCFASVITAIGRNMFQFPSHTFPLSFFGTIVGDEINFWDFKIDDDNENLQKTKKIINATISLLKLGIEELEHIDHKKLSTGDSCTLLKCLSPLLMLRRVPSIYFKRLHSWIFEEAHASRDVISILSKLCQLLAKRLEIDVDNSIFSALLNPGHHPTQSSFSSEERRLAAEIIGRCLPFYSPEDTYSSVKNYTEIHNCDEEKITSCFSFETIIAPSFCSSLYYLDLTLENSKSRFGDKKIVEQECIICMKKARAALYVACNHVSIAADEKNATGILFVIIFCLEILSRHTYETMKEYFQTEVVQLQTGCINFLSLCLSSWAERNVRRKKNIDKRDKGTIDSSFLIQDLSQSENNAEISKVSRINSVTKKEDYFKSLSDLFGLLISVVTTTKPPSWFEMVRRKHIGIMRHYLPSPLSFQHLADSNITFDIKTRTCLLNAFVLTSQNCPIQEGRLTIFANAVLPRLLTWGAQSKIDKGCYHPLCVAGVLQTIFICITRMKSFEGIKELSSTNTYKQNVHKSHEWVIHILKSSYTNNSEGVYAHDMMRLSALKLMLAIACIDQEGDNQSSNRKDISSQKSFLSPGEIAETFSVLHGAANIDSNPQVKELALRVLTILNSKIMKH